MSQIFYADSHWPNLSAKSNSGTLYISVSLEKSYLRTLYPVVYRSGWKPACSVYQSFFAYFLQKFGYHIDRLEIEISFSKSRRTQQICGDRLRGIIEPIFPSDRQKASLPMTRHRSGRLSGVFSIDKLKSSSRCLFVQDSETRSVPSLLKNRSFPSFENSDEKMKSWRILSGLLRDSKNLLRPWHRWFLAFKF